MFVRFNGGDVHRGWLDPAFWAWVAGLTTEGAKREAKRARRAR